MLSNAAIASISPTTISSSTRVIRWVTALLFCLLCVWVTHWILVFSSMRALVVPAQARQVRMEPTTGNTLPLLFGGAQGAVVLAQNVALLGIVADAGGKSTAIVAVNGQPPVAVLVGQSVVPDLRLVEVKARSVVIEWQGKERKELRLPKRQDEGIVLLQPSVDVKQAEN